MGVTVVTSGGSVTVTTGAPASASVSNSDDTYTATVAAGGSLEIPDITITKNDDTTVTYPAAKDLDIGDIDPPSAVPSTWDEMVAEYGQGYVYPISRETTSYRTGDEKDIEDTIFAAARAANKLKVFNTLASKLVLNNNNAFGNTSRYTSELGNQTYTNNLIIDHFTGLMWFKIVQSQSIWINAIDNALSATDGGYSDWFMASANQMWTILNDRSIGGLALNYEPFNNSSSLDLWTSTTEAGGAAGLDWENGLQFNGASFGLSRGYYLCRKHY